jgi:hypothetical protein
VNKRHTSADAARAFQNCGMIKQTSAGRQLDADLDADSARIHRDIEELQRGKVQRDKVQRAEEMRELKQQLEAAREEREVLRKSKVSPEDLIACVRIRTETVAKASFSPVLPAWLATFLTAGGMAFIACVIL